MGIPAIFPIKKIPKTRSYWQNMQDALCTYSLAPVEFVISINNETKTFCLNNLGKTKNLNLGTFGEQCKARDFYFWDYVALTKIFQSSYCKISKNNNDK